MADLNYLAAGLVFFGACLALIRLCDRLLRG
mgnify:CR=1 FL=1